MNGSEYFVSLSVYGRPKKKKTKQNITVNFVQNLKYPTACAHISEFQNTYKILYFRVQSRSVIRQRLCEDNKND